MVRLIVLFNVRKCKIFANLLNSVLKYCDCIEVQCDMCGQDANGKDNKEENSA